MPEIYEKLRGAALFRGIGGDELIKLFGCLNAREQVYEKGGIILLAGDKLREVGLVLSGRVEVVSEDFSGNRNILEHIGEGGLFGEMFATADLDKSPVTIIAETRTKVMFADVARILSVCGESCGFHIRLIKNLLGIVALKNLELQDKVECLGNRNIKEKVDSFLNKQQKRAGTNPFKIPFTRAQMADYLCVNRSALSAVLCSMRDEGLIRFKKNNFWLMEKPGG